MSTSEQLTTTSELELEIRCPRCEGRGGEEERGNWCPCCECEGAGYLPTEIGKRVLAWNSQIESVDVRRNRLMTSERLNYVSGSQRPSGK